MKTQMADLKIGATYRIEIISKVVGVDVTAQLLDWDTAGGLVRLDVSHAGYGPGQIGFDPAEAMWTITEVTY